MTANLSGVYKLDLTANDIITESLEILQATGDGEDLDGNDYQQAKSSLNIMLKLWEAQGLHLWTEEEYTLFLKVGQRIYDFNLEETRVVDAESWYSTTITADVVVSAVSIEVTSTDNMVTGQAIGLLSSDNDIYWNIIERIDGLTVYLQDAVTVSMDSGAYVRFYDTENLGRTTLSAPEAIGQTELSVTTTEGMLQGMQIGILADDDSVFWTTINSFDVDADTVTVNDALIADSAAGNAVVFYSSVQNYTPISRIANAEAMRRHSGEASDYEIPINLHSRQEYMQLPNKLQQGTVIQTYFSQQQPQGKLYVWNAPSTAVEYLNFTAEREIQLIVEPDNTFDLPIEWYDALTYQLAKRLIPKIGCSPERKADILLMAEDCLDMVLSFDNDIYGVTFVPETDHG